MSSNGRMQYPLGEVTRGHHYAISVRDMDAMVAWYQEKLGAVVTGAWDPEELGAHVRIVTVNGFSFELVSMNESSPSSTQWGDPPGMAIKNGPFHMAFTVDDCAAAVAELKLRDVKFAWDVADYDELKMRCAHFWDLEGNILELVEVLD
ncbi:VOC family protein [Pseudarthrobacter sp. NPDC055928]|uniref:VOC family protein n=1 Tax=unclassified Pseudarthrobacter TaxID=2647000 RepID=UPI00307853D7